MRLAFISKIAVDPMKISTIKDLLNVCSYN
jgi:hypothetical protein